MLYGLAARRQQGCYQSAPVERPRSPVAAHDFAMVCGTTALRSGDARGDGDCREKQELSHDELLCTSQDETEMIDYI